MKFSAYLLHDHHDVTPRNRTSPADNHTGEIGIDITMSSAESACSPAPTYPNSRRYASRLCSDRAMETSLLLDGDLHLSHETIPNSEAPYQRFRTRDRPDDEMQPVRIRPTLNVRA